FHQTLALFRVFAEERTIVWRVISCLRKCNSQGRQELTGAVVELASDVSSFLVLGSKQMAREIAELFRLSNDFRRAVSDLCVQTLRQLAIVVFGALEIGNVDACRMKEEDMTVTALNRMTSKVNDVFGIVSPSVGQSLTERRALRGLFYGLANLFLDFWGASPPTGFPERTS